ncbi:cupin [Streptomyces bobili]|uniref:cupin n=1 Tax=Streptomyces bobili TaxID=67280 RepID=UPI00364C3C1E
MTPTLIDLFASALQFRPDGEVRPAERQMAAEEAVCCLTGGARIHFRPTTPGDAEDVVQLRAGTAVIVPRGRWHRLKLDAPSDLMSITLRQGTRLGKRTDTH